MFSQISRKSLHLGLRRISTTTSLRQILKIQSAEEFEEKVIKSTKPVIVDFFATWCGPCKMLTPRIESIISETKNVTLAKVDVDEFSELALDYEVASVPVLIALSKGKVTERLVGLQDTDKLRKWVGDIAAKG